MEIHVAQDALTGQSQSLASESPIRFLSNSYPLEVSNTSAGHT